jgi:hypothetical protein
MASSKRSQPPWAQGSKRPRVDVVAVELTPDVVAGLSLKEAAAQSWIQTPMLSLGENAVYLKLDGWLDLKFGVDARVWEKPDDPSARPETARLHVNLADATLPLLKALDAKAQRLFEADEERKGLNWQSLLKRSEKTQYAHIILKVCFQARPTTDVRATEMKIRLPGGGVAKGAGWSFLDAHMASCDGFREGQCRALLDAQFWCMNGSAGLTLNVVALALRPSAKCLEAKHFCIDEVFPDSDM